MNKKTTDFGVIVARFQVARLHDAHKDLIQTVCNDHAKVIIFLGLAPNLGTKNNPLDFESRKKMVLETFPDVNVLYINDRVSDEDWSRDLDRQLSNPHLVAPGKTVTLYGSRDSFIQYYTGKFPTQELIPESTVSGTESRKLAGTKVKGTQDFREGAIWITQNQWPRVIATVDIALINRKDRKLLLGRKPNEKLLRFIGGYSTPNSQSFEEDAARELKEETHIEVGDLQYIGSTFIKDWRYEDEEDKIKTTFFFAEYTFGVAQADDDIAETKWVSLDLGQELKKLIVPEHQVLVEMLLKYLDNLR